MLVYQKTMFDRYYCIQSFFSLVNFGKFLRKVHICITIIQKHEGFVGFEKNCPRTNTYVTLTSLNYINFYERYC